MVLSEVLFIFVFRSPGFRTITFICQGGSSEIFAGHGTLSKEDASFFDPVRAQCTPLQNICLCVSGPHEHFPKNYKVCSETIPPPPPNLEHSSQYVQ